VLTTETLDGVATPVTEPLEPLLDARPLQAESVETNMDSTRSNFNPVENDVVFFMAISFTLVDQEVIVCWCFWDEK